MSSHDDELRTARGAICELERKVFEQEQAMAVMRACLDRHQRDAADPPGYLQDAVIRASGMGAMAEEIKALVHDNREMLTALNEYANGEDARDAAWWRALIKFTGPDDFVRITDEAGASCRFVSIGRLADVLSAIESDRATHPPVPNQTGEA